MERVTKTKFLLRPRKNVHILKCWFLLFLCSFALVVSPASSFSQRRPTRKTIEDGPNNRPMTARQIADKVSKSLVVVFTQDIDGKPLAQGSGFFYGIPEQLKEHSSSKLGDEAAKITGIGSRGKPTSSGINTTDFVVSNLHVFRRAWSGKVKLVGSDTTYPIKRIVGIDIRHDLCVFEIENLTAPPLLLADTEEIGIGDDIYVAGNPRGLENTFSRGIISSIRKKEGFLQIDAAISPGSSGGPVVDTSGNVVGVAAASITSGQNLNFAVAGSYLLKLRLTWNASVKETGAFSINDAENDGLVGRVKWVKTSVAEKIDDDTELNVITAKPERSCLYNEDGNHQECRTFDSNGKFYSLFKTDYDNRGIRSHITVLAQDRMPSERSYTDQQNLEVKLAQRYYGISKEIEYESKSGLKVKETKTYDRNGNEIERMRRGSNASYSRLTFEYDERNRCITETDYRDGKLFAITTYRYNVDALGNWISQTAIIDIGEGVEPFENKKVFREISYY